MPKLLEPIRIGDGGPVVYWGIAGRQEEQPEALARSILARAPGTSLLLAPYAVEDWGRDFSPWPCDAPAFGGGGRDTAAWLAQEAIPAAEGDAPAERHVRYLLGYSLAGLFSLWNFYESGLFRGAACCSGSLWFPGWTDYAAKAAAPDGSRVYLSLGGREERSADPLMAQVGTLTRQQDALLARDPGIAAHTLEWNAGGHFSDPIGRLAKGAVWLLNAGKAEKRSVK